jgi:hypothetical protein
MLSLYRRCVDQFAGSTEKMRPLPLNACGNLRIAMFPSSYFWNTSALGRVRSVRMPFSFAALSQQTAPVRLVSLTTNGIGGPPGVDAVILPADHRMADHFRYSASSRQSVAYAPLAVFVLPTLGWRYIRYGGPPFRASLDSFSALIWRFRASISSGEGR